MLSYRRSSLVLRDHGRAGVRVVLAKKSSFGCPVRVEGDARHVRNVRENAAWLRKRAGENGAQTVGRRRIIPLAALEAFIRCDHPTGLGRDKFAEEGATSKR